MLCDVFHFEVTDGGGRLVLTEGPAFSFPLCMSDAEIEANAKDLWDHVEHMIARMKRALEDELRKPDFADADPT